MACSCEVLERDGKILDRFTNENGDLRIEVSRIGAELVSLTKLNSNGEWVGFLVRDGEVKAPAQGWGNHATVMGYYLHRLKGGESTYRGHKIAGGNHSFIRNKLFRTPAISSNSLTYEVAPKDYSAEDYPFAVSLKLSYHLTSDGVGVEFNFENHESCNSAHVGFGLHPGFAVHDIPSARVLMPPGFYVRLLAPGNFLSGEQEAFEFAGGEMPFEKANLEGSYILDLAGVPSRIFTVEDPVGRKKIELDYSETPYLTIWSDGGPFVCVEPCWGLPDHQEQKPFEDKLGIQEIAPDGQLKAGFTMRPSLF